MTEIDHIIGMPPENTLAATNAQMRNSMPLVKIYPGLSSFAQGMDIYQRLPAFESDSSKGKESKVMSYHALLQKHKFILNQPEADRGEGGCLVLAYLADSFPTDSFTNEYGENFLADISNLVSEKAGAMAQMFGVESGSQAMDKLLTAGEKQGGLAALIAGFTRHVGAGITKSINAALPNLAGGAKMLDVLLAGSRLDFPMVWKTSGFTPSYTMTVRLYNPDPGDLEVTKRFIIGPIAAIMLLGIPRSNDATTFRWPFIHRFYSPGIFDLDPGFISNITIVKGGDQQQISFNQRLAVVDVRIDFGSLFSTMLASGKNMARTRPTLHKYLEALTKNKTGVVTRNMRIMDAPLQTEVNQAPAQADYTDEEYNSPTSRVTETAQWDYEDLKSQLPAAVARVV